MKLNDLMDEISKLIFKKSLDMALSDLQLQGFTWGPEGKVKSNDDSE